MNTRCFLLVICYRNMTVEQVKPSQQDKMSAVNFFPQTIDTFKFEFDVTCLLLYLTFISQNGSLH